MQSQPIDFHPPATKPTPSCPRSPARCSPTVPRVLRQLPGSTPGRLADFPADLEPCPARGSAGPAQPAVSPTQGRSNRPVPTPCRRSTPSSLPRPAAWRLALQQLVQRLPSHCPGKRPRPPSRHCSPISRRAPGSPGPRHAAQGRAGPLARAAQLPFVAPPASRCHRQLARPLEASASQQASMAAASAPAAAPAGGQHRPPRQRRSTACVTCIASLCN